MHSANEYHDFILSSARDRSVRERFQREVFRLLPAPAKILDFGAGTGIDGKVYAAHGYNVFVHEPAESMRTQLSYHCREELDDGRIAHCALDTANPVHLVTANFAVLNLIADRREQFRQFADVLLPRGYVLASVLNPWFVCDARYAWWRKNFFALLRRGSYSVAGASGPIYRFTTRVAAREAQPEFRLAEVKPGRVALRFSRFVFMLFQKA